MSKWMYKDQLIDRDKWILEQIIFYILVQHPPCPLIPPIRLNVTADPHTYNTCMHTHTHTHTPPSPLRSDHPQSLLPGRNNSWQLSSQIDTFSLKLEDRPRHAALHHAFQPRAQRKNTWRRERERKERRKERKKEKREIPNRGGDGEKERKEEEIWDWRGLMNATSQTDL